MREYADQVGKKRREIRHEVEGAGMDAQVNSTDSKEREEQCLYKMSGMRVERNGRAGTERGYTHGAPLRKQNFRALYVS